MLKTRSRLRLVVVQMMVLSLFLTLFARLWYLQVVGGETYQAAAADNAVTLPGPAGQAVTTLGRALTVWRREPGGEWRCAIDIWNDGPPEP